MELYEFLEELLLQGEKYFTAYTIIFIVIVLNSLQICLSSDRKLIKNIFQISESFLLIIAMGFIYLANVLVIDAAGKSFYFRTKQIDTLSLIFIIVGLLFLFASIIVCFFKKRKNKNTQNNFNG